MIAGNPRLGGSLALPELWRCGWIIWV